LVEIFSIILSSFRLAPQTTPHGFDDTSLAAANRDIGYTIRAHRSNYLTMSLSLDALAVLDAIARRGSFAAAAAELGKVPSALTYTVRRLEDELDVLIFDRRGKRARLTAAGAELLEQGRVLIRAADDIVCRVKEVASGWEVELRIALDGVVAFRRMRPSAR
jgi:molybdenum-dependent DNA-binding transcriptional regulator ModE